MKSFLTFLCGVMLVFGMVSGVGAVPISGLGDPMSDPNLTGGTQIDFDSASKGTYTSLTIGDVTFLADDRHLDIDDTYAGQYNTTGNYLDNQDYSDNGFSSITFLFSNPVSAFAFNWGASNQTWTLTAYDSSNNVLESITLPVVRGSNSGEYYGIAKDGISYATASIDSCCYHYDWILLDNFTFKTSGGSASVPEPSSMFLLGVGLAGLAGYGRKQLNKKS